MARWLLGILVFAALAAAVLAWLWREMDRPRLPVSAPAQTTR